MSAAHIVSIETRLIRVPLIRPWDEVSVNHFVSVTVVDNESRVGEGFAWTPSIGAKAVQALIENDIRDFAVGRSADPEELWEPLWTQLHEAGGGGLTTIGMSAVDLALWDLVSRKEDVSVPERIGLRRRHVAVYGSGVNRHLPIQDLVSQAKRWVEAGLRAVKIKVGGRPLSEDVERVAAVREVIGTDSELMIDANQLWNIEEATRAATALDRFDLKWLEEPIRADDLLGYQELRRRTGIPLAAGENIYTRYRFNEFLDSGALTFLQPNVIRVGGITSFLKIAADACRLDTAVYPHLLPELSGQLALCLPAPCLIEDVEDSSLASLGVLRDPSPLRISGPTATLAARPGLGLALRQP